MPSKVWAVKESYDKVVINPFTSLSVYLRNAQLPTLVGIGGMWFPLRYERNPTTACHLY
ncbi:MAG: hypothetical protein KGI27_06090 [Thaumarchaeota archaeon]|nr:hypothetical protein [Nitrososphaerota archaeon]